MAFMGVMPRQEQPIAVRWVKRVCIAAFAIHMVLFSWSIYRRLVQINHIELTTSSNVLAPGVKVSYDVITSGEVRNRILLELVQGAHREVVGEQLSRVNYISGYDPRIFRYERAITLTPEFLSRFVPGPATLRLTGFGSQKLLQTPAPRVRELPVQIR
jgi:hypothetical protein